jgi:transposase
VPDAKARAEIVVIDNLLQVHKMKKVRELIEGHGCSLGFPAALLS